MDSDDFDILFQKFRGTWIIGGDYNAKHSTWGSRLTNTRGRELTKVLTQRRYEALSSGEPTYWPSHHGRIPDIIDFFVSRGITREQCRVSTEADLSLDHVPVILTISSIVERTTINQSAYRLEFVSRTRQCTLLPFRLHSHVNCARP